jgi:hypothetical protein
MKRVTVARSTVDEDAKSESSASLVLTHEERQAVYEKARARIFSDYVESQKGAGAEKAVGVVGGSSDEAGSESTIPPVQIIARKSFGCFTIGGGFVALFEIHQAEVLTVRQVRR